MQQCLYFWECLNADNHRSGCRTILGVQGDSSTMSSEREGPKGGALDVEPWESGLNPGDWDQRSRQQAAVLFQRGRREAGLPRGVYAGRGYLFHLCPSCGHVKHRAAWDHTPLMAGN